MRFGSTFKDAPVMFPGLPYDIQLVGYQVYEKIL